MKLFLLKLTELKKETDLHSLLEGLTEKNDFCVFSSVDGMVEALRRPFNSPPIGVFSLRGKEDLEMLTPYIKLLLRIRLVLVLPGLDPETVSLAHSFRPKFLTRHQADPTNLKEVCLKMLASFPSSPTDESGQGDSKCTSNQFYN